MTALEKADFCDEIRNKILDKCDNTRDLIQIMTYLYIDTHVRYYMKDKEKKSED